MGNGALRSRLIDAGLVRVADEIVRVAKPSVRMDCARVENEDSVPPGGSKLGGRPDLPSVAAWPGWGGGRMAFVAQVNLADIAVPDEEGALPHSGLLSFFAAIDGTAAAVLLSEASADSKVLYFEGDPGSLARPSFPSGLPPSLHYRACRARFWRELTLPHVDSREIARLGLSEPERHAYVGLSFDPTYMSHRLLGAPAQLDRFPFLGCYLEERGVRGTARGKLGPQELEDLEHKAQAEWLLLLQVYANEEAEMDFGGGGALYFGIPKDALAQKAFDRVCVDMQFV